MKTRRAGQQHRPVDLELDADLIRQAERLGIEVWPGTKLGLLKHLVETRQAERDRRRRVLAAASTKEKP